VIALPRKRWVGAAGQFVPQCPSSTGRPSLTPHQHAEALKHLTKRRDDLIRHIAKNDEVDELARSLYYVDHAIATLNGSQVRSGERVATPTPRDPSMAGCNRDVAGTCRVHDRDHRSRPVDGRTGV
jgi:hypothetical protein